MPRNIKKLYQEILTCVSELETFCTDKSFDDFKQDRGLQLIVERELEIIGEALSRLKREFPDEAQNIKDLHKIIGLRNILAHGYDIIDHDILWDIVENKLHVLKETILHAEE